MSIPSFTHNDDLLALQNELASQSLISLFVEDSHRVDKYSCEAAGLYLDYSKNRVNDRVLALLFNATREKGLAQRVQSLIRGEIINYTEKRPALHTALRGPSHAPAVKLALVAQVQAKMTEFVNAVHSGHRLGATGRTITDIVNIGIGGSDLGPLMVTEALKPYQQKNIRSHFVSNVDAADLFAALDKANPETTLFVVASKTFTTLETLTNALTARRWLTDALGDGTDVSKHFVATTSNIENAVQFGIDEANIFPMWDWVGGRYSLWSSIGMPIALGVGMKNFTALLAGASEMDNHFSEQPLENNLPVILALLGVWYTNYWGAHTHAIIPYAHDLRLFPKYLQQLDMESNGKSAAHGGLVNYDTGPIIWGEAGTNGQHSFHQLLHQGTRLVPVDFIAPLRAQHAHGEHQTHLFANCLSQSYALMVGKTLAQARQEFIDIGYSETESDQLAHHKVMTGDRPTNTILMDKLTPQTLGALIALYEHKVFVQSVMWDINPFDQWGVELGKKISTLISGVVTDGADGSTFDASTQNLIKRFQNAQKPEKD